MKIFSILILCSILSLFYFKSNILKCAEEEIENCEKCGTGDKANTCIECKDNHFLFFNNLYCIPCDDPTYGNIGCKGSCDASNYLNDGNIMCNECKEGFYNLNGICFNCTYGSPGCKRCTVIMNENAEAQYICEECLNNEYILDSVYGTCNHCWESINCKKCHYENHNSVCDECYDGFYKDNYNHCQKCKDPIEIENGYCRICSDDLNDLESGPCWCKDYYALKSHSTCVRCPDNCPYCEYNYITNKVECISCDAGYTLNSEKTCTFCGIGCEFCFLSDDSTPICSLCFSRTFSSDNKCLVCPNNCKSCILNEYNQIKCIECYSKNILLSDGTCAEFPPHCSSCGILENNIISCTKCDDHYALNNDNECVSCSSINQEGMKGCDRCGYNKEKNIFECYECEKKEREDSYKKYEIYAYVTNTFQCFNNSDINQPSFYGCLKAYYDEGTQKYECLTCDNYYYNYYYYYIMIINEKRCKTQSEMDLMNCYEAINIGTEANPIYSCNKCYDNTAKIISRENNRTNCYSRDYRILETYFLAYCLEGEEDNNNIKCKKCVDNANFKNNDICECNPYSFGSRYYQWCYKCDDKNYGNPGCNLEKGCNYYFSNDQLNCNQCKDGYFNFTEGQCYSCSNEIRNCEKCHFDNSDRGLICDQCLEGYSYNSKGKVCELQNCEDYPEISEGCIICEGKLEEYVTNKKCQKCKPGYFKTKDEQCINCRSEKYGGPDCIKCIYGVDENGNESNDIKCEFCPKRQHAINSDGKCFNCQNSLSTACEECKFTKINGNTEKLVCTLCLPGYYLNSDGKCIYYLNYLEKIPNCYEYTYTINNIKFCTYNYYYYEKEYYYDNYYYQNYYSTYYCIYDPNIYYYDYYDYNYYITYSYLEYKQLYNYTNFTIPKINSSIKGQCISCEDNYYLNYDGNCEKIYPEDCSLISIAEEFPKRYSICRRFCNYNNIYVQIKYKKNTNNNGDSEEENNEVILDMYEFFENIYYGNNQYYNGIILDKLDNNLKQLFIKSKLCIPRTEQFNNCRRVLYDVSTNDYKCSECYENSILDINSNSCKYHSDNYNDYYENYNCIVENIGTITNPIYSCSKCYNDQYYLLVSTENNINYCIYKEEKEEIKYCLEAKANTTYINTVYNCTSCTFNFLPYKSKFFERQICQNIYNKIITKKDINLGKYKDVESVNIEKGICPKNTLFTPDKEKCYQCNNKDVGMPGCKGACNFSLERNNILKCEEECEIGYIEASEGVCESCDSVNHGCYECHYEDEYPANYLGIKRKRRFVCDYCESGYIKSDGKCLTCEDLDLEDCDECQIDPNNNNQYKCTKCNKWSVLIDGFCYECFEEDSFQMNNHCYDCNDFNNGGIKGCNYCEKDNNNKLICQRCLSGYILLSNNNTCLNISENKELEKFD